MQGKMRKSASFTSLKGSNVDKSQRKRTNSFSSLQTAKSTIDKASKYDSREAETFEERIYIY